MSKSAYAIFIAIFLVTSFISFVIRIQIPESYRLIYDATLALIALVAALFEQTVIRKSIFMFLLFLVLPIVFVIVSLTLWLFDIPYHDLDVWVAFVYWDSLVLFNFLIRIYLLRKEIVK